MHRHFRHHDREACSGRERWMRGLGHPGRGLGRGRHRGAGRFFDQGDLRLVILSLIAEQSSHGYQLIKTLEERTGGVYAPSPGVIYPTLTLLEEQGLIEQSGSDGAKKLFAITDDGRAALEAEAASLKAILSRLQESGDRAPAFSPRLFRAQASLRMALKMKFMQGPLSAEQVDRVTDALEAAIKAIDEA